MNDKQKNIIIIGGGLVGSLCACLMAKRKYHVTLYEKRSDLRKETLARGRSINLSLSHRGRKSLRLAGIEEQVLKDAIPMKGRMLHSQSGALKSVLYDPVQKECIYSVGRNDLNRQLLDVAESYENVELYFNHKLIKANFEKGTVTLQKINSAEIFEAEADLIIGADGAYSKLRSFMQNSKMFHFSQTYIEHGYLELRIPSSMGCKMASNHLHIWPRGEFMMIALPNKDQSWTVTLFMPFERFAKLTDEKKLLEFFESTFPDSVPLIGESDLIKLFFSSKPQSLVSVECSPHHVAPKFLLIGDSAHAMVPFYGQGMNAGFEDCFILNQLLDLHEDNIAQLLESYTLKRVKDAHAICELAMYNYIEMRDLVSRKSYLLRKAVDDFLYKVLGNKWIPLYNSVSFSSMDYQQCINNRKWQDQIITKIMVLIPSVFFIFSLVFIFFM